MSRATLVYIIMLVAGIGGLWAILGAGTGLRAPTDLSGAWEVGSEDATVTEALGETVDIEQSGRFLHLEFSNGLAVDVRLKDENLPDPQSGQLLDMVFEGRDWMLAALGDNADGPLLFKLVGPERHTFTVTRKRPGGDDDDVDDDDKAAPAGAPTQTADAAADDDTDAP